MNTRAKIFFTIIIILIIQSDLLSQTPISGIINKYTKIISINSSKDTLVVSDASLFSDGDTVLVMQMQGATARSGLTNQFHLYGSVTTSGVKFAGKYEIIIISKSLSGVNKIVLRNPLDKIYDISKNVQLISVPYFNSAEITSTITCAPWDGSKGGVVAIMVADTLSFKANIDVAGKGFRGANPVLSVGACASSDSALYSSYFFNETFNGAGRKGEGIAIYDAANAKGLGRWANGGGGGNARFAGGGGGGGAKSGGIGGAEDTLHCITPKYSFTNGTVWEGLGGNAGQGLESYFSDSTLFLGGGGGSGTYTSDLIASNGGNGGGIVIIISNYLKPNGFGIIADGQSVTEVATASGGGGGGGGAIVIDIDKVQSDILLAVNGGTGGNTQGVNISGPGGGGGGGIVLNGSTFIDPKFKLEYLGGFAGRIIDISGDYVHSAAGGNIGLSLNNYSIPLTGFLFNSILEKQNICIGEAPKLLTGSSPRGGDGNYTYQWQKRTPSTSWVLIPVADTSKYFQPPALDDTTFYRRIVSSAGVVDTSLAIGIYIHKKIVGNNIQFNDLDTICINNSASNIIGARVTQGGDGTGVYNYTWESSFNLSNWNSISPLSHPTNPVNDTICWGGIITDTTYYRRKVSSGACYSLSDTIEIIGLPKITNNIISDFQEICFGNMPEAIIGQLPQKGLGAGTYFYQWQSSYNSTNWATIADSARINFNPDTLKATRYYRRIVTSGDCQDISDNFKANVLPLIGSNSIVNSNVFTCYNIPSDILSGTSPTGGDNVYQYVWEISSDSQNWGGIGAENTNKDYQTLAQTDSMYYRRIVKAGIDDCCIDTSNLAKVNIWSLPIGVIATIADTTCSNGLVNLDINVSFGANPFTLYYTDGYSGFDTTFNSLSALVPVKPTSLVTSKEYIYTIDSLKDIHGCLATNLSGEAKVLAYGWPVANPGTDLEICDTTIVLYATPSLGNGIWSQYNGPGVAAFENQILPNSPVYVDVSGLYSLQWKEINWECSDSANVEILFYRKPINVNAGNDTAIYFETEHVLNGYYKNPDEIKDVSVSWDYISGPGYLSDENSLNAVVNDLYGFFRTKVQLLFTVSKGDENSECPDIEDTLNISLEPIFTPTGFSPNGDGINDYFIIKGADNTISSELIVFNKLGTEVYRKSNYSSESAWDGKNMKGEMLPEDTYFYIFSITDTFNKVNTKRGFVVLKGQGNE